MAIPPMRNVVISVIAIRLNGSDDPKSMLRGTPIRSSIGKIPSQLPQNGHQKRRYRFHALGKLI
jgi:hypothetical protein